MDKQMKNSNNWLEKLVGLQMSSKIPAKLKLGDLHKVVKMDENQIGKIQKTNDGKVLLRKAMSRHIPEDIHKAVKQGFSSPDNSWFKGDSIEYVKAKLLNSGVRYITYKAVSNTKHSKIYIR